MNEIIISGWFGHENTGDEAILSTMIKSISENIPESNVTVFSANPTHTMKCHGVSSISRTSINDSIKRLLIIKKCDLFILGGGGFLTDVSKTDLIRWLTPLFISQIYSKKTMVYSVGVNTIESKIGKYIIKSIFSKVNLITVRDELSKYRLENAGIKSEKILLTADPVHLIKCSSDNRAENILISQNIDIYNKTIIGICVPPYFHKESDWPEKSKQYKQYKIAISEYINLITNQFNYEVLFIPMHIPHDLDLAVEIKEMVKRKNSVHIIFGSYSPEDVASLIKKTKMILGMRLHSLILATVVGTPMVGIMYDDKVENYLQINGQKKYAVPHFIWDRTRWNDLKPTQLFNLTEAVLGNTNLIKKQLKEASNNSTEKSQKNTEYIKYLLNEKV